ncbi:MAG: hypothetical protein JKY56_25125 [Kofleriaceae bacterium]|nr:hypothetical protein [Kofleriaceae bacterium]
MRMLIAFLLSLAIVSPVQAQELSKKEKQRFSKLVRKAQRAQHKADSLAKRKKTAGKAMGRYKNAARSYLDAYQIKQSPSIIFLLSEIYKSRGELAWALRGYHRYLEVEPEGQYASAAAERIETIGEVDDPTEMGDSDIDPRAVFGEVEVPEKIAEEAPATPAPVVPKKSSTLTKPPAVKKPSESPGKLMRYSGLGAAGLGVLFVGLGVKFGLDASSASDDLSGRSGAWAAADRAKISDGESAETKSIVFSLVGAASIVGGGILYFLGSKDGQADDSRTSRLTPLVDSQGVSLHWMGNF